MGAYSITAVRTYSITAVRMYALYVPYVQNIGFRSLSFEKINLLNSYFIHRYIIIKYRSSSNLGKIHPLLWELWPLFNDIVWLKMVSVHYSLKRLVYWIHILYTGI